MSNPGEWNRTLLLTWTTVNKILRYVKFFVTIAFHYIRQSCFQKVPSTNLASIAVVVF
jgi:hypothetical protein